MRLGWSRGEAVVGAPIPTGLGLFVEGLKWALAIALVLLVVGVATGYRGRAV